MNGHSMGKVFKVFLTTCAVAALVLVFGIQAAPLAIIRRPDELCIFPHSLCISDFIGTGTPTSTNDGHSIEFAVDEVLWGEAPSTNITVRERMPNGVVLHYRLG